MAFTPDESNLRPAGYQALIGRFRLEVIPNWHESFIANKWVRRVEQVKGRIRETYSPAYWPGDDLGHHLENAPRHQTAYWRKCIAGRLVESPRPAADYCDGRLLD